MKSTSEINRPLRFAVVFSLLGVLSVLAVSCMTDGEQASKGKDVEIDRGYKFSHSQHVASGLDDCTVCHDPAAGNPTALSTPGHDLCSVCHEIPASGTTPPAEPAERDKCAFCHTRPDYTVTPWQPKLSKEVKWQHAAHITAEIACATCHEDMDTRSAKSAPSMAACMDCHAQKSAALNECTVCHNEITENSVPQFRKGQRLAHDAPEIWKKIHGQESRVDVNYCAMCHEKQNRCDDCHSVMPPDNHTAAFKHNSHGHVAMWDRNTCATCHEEHFCIKCHKEKQPVSHRAGWGDQRNTHCVNCHYPPERSGCAVCHENIEHESAMASPHSMALFPPNCAQCHPGGLPHQAPHLMNSSVHCSECHQ